jgi:hypothetical protein
MLNEHYSKAITAVKTMNKSGTSVFGALLTFAHEHRLNGTDALKAHFKAQEKLASSEKKVEMTKNSTYKVAKGKLVKAVDLGIDLMPDGKPMGKTALEEKIAEVEDALGGGTPAKTDFDKFSAALNTASKHADKVSDADVAIAAGLVSTLYAKLAARIPSAKAA